MPWGLLQIFFTPKDKVARLAWIVVLLLSSMALQSCTFRVFKSPKRVPASQLPRISIYGGNNQSIPVNTLTSSLQVLVVDTKNTPLSDVTVEFRLISGNGWLSASTDVTSVQGLAAVTVHSSIVAETMSIEASINGGADTVVFSVTALPGAPDSFQIQSGDGQNLVSGVDSDPLEIIVYDNFGNFVPDVSVDYEVITSVGALSAASSMTNSQGIASVTVNAPAYIGPIAVRANVLGSAFPKVFNLTSTVDLLTTTVTLGTPTVVSGSFTTFEVTIRDALGDPIDDGSLNINFLISGGSSTGAFGGVSYFGNGVYTADFYAQGAGTDITIETTIDSNSVLSTYPVLRVIPGPIDLSSTTYLVSNPTVASGSDVTVEITPRDAYGNPIDDSGLTVLPSYSGGTSTGAFGAFSYSSGVYSTTFTGDVAGTPITLLATIDGNSLTGSLPQLEVVAGPVAQISIQSGDAQSLPVNGTSQPLQIVLSDAIGNPVSNAIVDFAITSGTGSLSSGSEATDSQGLAAVTLLLDGTSGSRTVRASAESGTLFVDFTIMTIGEIELVRNFGATVGVTPYSAPILLNGELYGTTQSGGNVSQGVVYRVNLDGTGYVALHEFSGTDGALPFAGLKNEGAWLYGTTSAGGAFGGGVVFRVGLDGANYEVLYEFSGPDGKEIFSEVTLNSGSIYGTAFSGGDSDKGIVYRMDSDGANFIILHHFSGPDGASPYSGVTVVGADLFGTTEAGGGSGQGVVFRLGVDGSNFLNLHEFTGNDGAQPKSTPFQVGSEIYGAVFQGGTNGLGSLYKVNVDGTGFNVFYHFDGTAQNPLAGVIVQGGTVYGTVQGGGWAGQGMVYQVGTDGSGFSPILELDGNSGSIPGSLSLDGSTLYGVGISGGGGGGTIFKIDTNATNYSLVYQFSSLASASPYSGITRSGSFFFGTTVSGGDFNGGSIYRLNADGTGFTSLHHFDGSQGSTPRAKVISDGTFLYGTTEGGGASGAGVIFRLANDGSGYTVLHSFAGGSGGAASYAPLIFVGGALYGVALLGGTSNAGVVFKINTDGTGYSVLHHFNGTLGAYPGSGLIEDSGVLYGVTDQGGSNNSGVVFKINIDGTGYAVLHHFNGTNGSLPSAQLLSYGGQLYGTTYNGGSSGQGVIYRISPSGSGFTVLRNLSGTSANPSSGLIVTNSQLYGVAMGGAVFRIQPDGTGFTELGQLNGTNGSTPEGDLLLYNNILWGTGYQGGSFNVGTLFKLQL